MSDTTIKHCYTLVLDSGDIFIHRQFANVRRRIRFCNSRSLRVSHFSIFFLFPIIPVLLQKCLCECQTWIMRETSGMRTVTRTEESVSAAWMKRRAGGRPAVNAAVFCPLPVSNTRFIAAVIERHTHTPERRRRYWGRSGTESDHGKNSPP